MMPKYIFDKAQQTLDKSTQIDKIYTYRKILYNDLIEKLNILNAQKKALINSYKIAISEIDYELNAQKQKSLREKIK